MRERFRPELEELRMRSLASERMPPGYKQQLKGAVLARIALAAPGTLAAGQATASGRALGMKAVVGLAVVGALGAGSFWALRPARRSAPVAAQHTPEAPPGRAPVVVVAAPPPVAVAVAVAVVKPAPKTSSQGKRVVERGVFVPEPGTLPREITLMGEADRALRAGDTEKAIAMLDEHAALFPTGTLAPERAAERLIVSCRVGDADPRAVAEFLAANPGSPLAARVRRACALDPSAPVPRHP